jgi:RimJ/RimL family protein N-acetyltransferase
MMNVRIIHLTGDDFAALAAGDRTTAGTENLSEWLAGPECRSVWRRRHAQFEQDPATAAWVTGIIWDDDARVAVGRAGYHGPPDADGMVEIGYAVDPAYRRRGYARAALEALLARARDEPAVHRVRVSIRPDNVGSYRLAAQFGFAKVGEQWDDEDGLEYVYEI